MKRFLIFLFFVFLGGIVMAQSFSGDFVLVPSGNFMMGSAVTEDWRENDEMQHKVFIDSFYIAKSETTQEEYERVMKKNPSQFRGKNLPVENVSFLDAVEYCNEKSKFENLTPCYSINGQKLRGIKTQTATDFQQKLNGNTHAEPEQKLRSTLKNLWTPMMQTFTAIILIRLSRITLILQNSMRSPELTERAHCFCKIF